MKEAVRLGENESTEPLGWAKSSFALPLRGEHSGVDKLSILCWILRFT